MLEDLRREIAGLFVAGCAVGMILLLAGCQAGGPSTTPPSGWQSTDDRWWKEGVDTTHVFRSMSNLAAMGIKLEDVVYSGGGQLGPEAMRMQLTNALKKQFVPLYRHQPQVIDSIFAETVVPLIQKTEPPSKENFDQAVNDLKKKGYQELRRHFSEPRTRLQLGDDVPIAYPDSLRQQDVGGEVRMQVYLNKKGEPQSVRLLEGPHPVLNRMSMWVATQMRWEPAQVDGSPIASWVRYSITY